ncbi:flagellar biosynthesis regulator FlhF [Shouchella clausii]|uniref:Flagellar biosynthesis protein FlhF n=1 Tax=Shouchella rhizosphaerae TaxID=866786 RepID=A0ABZ2CUR2_9BACI|nr:hypothetical protein [Shouchella clausii]GIN15843.1 flagellar biosynthesis regulator FlhF [Shouchella clausii]
MNVKRFVAPTLEDAAKDIRKQLGKDAVILHVKEVVTGGLFGFFGKKQVQVTAGIDGPSHRNSVSRDGDDKQSPLLKEANRHLQQLGVSNRVLKNLQLTAQMADKQGNARTKEELLMHTFRASLQLQPFLQKRQQTLIVAGPTGVGKTTTIAKLAAKAMFEENKTVSFITFDTYRIAAVEQLKTYAHILDCPIYTAYNESELIDLCGRQTADLVLVDTAGRNYLHEQMPVELVEYIRQSASCDLVVALSLAAKAEDARHMLSRFPKELVNGLILTKLDETASLGTLCELLYSEAIPVACVTTGQNVPEDICWPDKEQLLKWLTGGV